MGAPRPHSMCSSLCSGCLHIRKYVLGLQDAERVCSWTPALMLVMEGMDALVPLSSMCVALQLPLPHDTLQFRKTLTWKRLLQRSLPE